MRTHAFHPVVIKGKEGIKFCHLATLAQQIAMAPKIKLTYFDVRARAELSRIILAQAGVEYEDCRIKGEEWQKMKPGKEDDVTFIAKTNYMRCAYNFYKGVMTNHVLYLECATNRMYMVNGFVSSSGQPFI